MIIRESSIQLYSEHSVIEQHTRRESLKMWQNGSTEQFGKHRLNPAGRHEMGNHFGNLDRIALSREAQASVPKRALATEVENADKNIADLNIRILRAMIQRLTGKVMDVRLPQDVASGSQAGGDVGGVNDSATPVSAGFGLEYDSYESRYEYEATNFSAGGMITTADGQEISFDVQMSMSREFMQEQRVSVRAGDALKDPLAVHFNGNSSELTQTSYSFDIDMDGRTDQIAFPQPGSGFLALDKNLDGRINDGSELFGPSTGNGFEELSAYDNDGSGWIDENDSIFSQLRIWSRTPEGENRLFSLGEVGIGAIYLHHIATPFSIKNDDNQLLGQVRDSGIFVRENGTVGTIQQIDLAV